MCTNFLGIFLFATLFNYSLQYVCYDCKTTVGLNSSPQTLNQKPLALPSNACPDDLAASTNATKDCPGACALVDYKSGNTQFIYRSCSENIDCQVQNETIQNIGGTMNYCGTCEEDKCNSAISILASSSFLGICISFLLFRSIFL